MIWPMTYDLKFCVKVSNWCLRRCWKFGGATRRRFFSIQENLRGAKCSPPIRASVNDRCIGLILSTRPNQATLLSQSNFRKYCVLSFFLQYTCTKNSDASLFSSSNPSKFMTSSYYGGWENRGAESVLRQGFHTISQTFSRERALLRLHTGFW